MEQVTKTNRGGGQRSSNFELLRILMILSILGHHFVVNSGITNMYDFKNITGNMIFLQIFGMWGKTSINVFTLITGYFMVKKELTIKRLLRLYLEMKFYYILFYIIFLFSGYEPFSIKTLIKGVLFTTVYEAGSLYGGTMLIMYLFIPFVNVLARNMNQKQYKCLLALLLLYFTGFSTFMKHNTFNFTFWMLTCYLIGGYIRMYPSKWDNKRNGILITVISVILMIASIILIDFVGVKIGFINPYYFMADSHKFLAVTASFGIFITFKNWKLPNSKLVNVMASSTLGVLMIHANSDTMRRFLWKDLFDNAGHYNSPMMWLYACLVVLLVYIVCIILDQLRIEFIEKPLFSWLGRYDWMNKQLY